MGLIVVCARSIGLTIHTGHWSTSIGQIVTKEIIPIIREYGSSYLIKGVANSSATQLRLGADRSIDGNFRQWILLRKPANLLPAWLPSAARTSRSVAVPAAQRISGGRAGDCSKVVGCRQRLAPLVVAPRALLVARLRGRWARQEPEPAGDGPPRARMAHGVTCHRSATRDFAVTAGLRSSDRSIGPSSLRRLYSRRGLTVIIMQ
jgi:hypothetical protein